MSVLKKLAIALVGLALAVAAVGLLLPRTVHVERSITVDRPPATLFTLLNSFESFNRWSPWFELDPEATYTYEGPQAGVGARILWAGNPDTLGSGSQEIVESRPYDRVRMTLDFGQEGTATAGFALTPDAGATRVTWDFDTDLGMNPANRYMGLFFDRWMGQDFEKGLARLKALAESLPAADFAGLDVEIVDVSPATLAFLSTSTTKDEAEIAKVLAESYGEIAKFIADAKLEAAGPPLVVTTKVDDAGYAFQPSIPVTGAPAEPVAAESRVQVKPGYGGRAVTTVHRGAYSGLPAAYDKLFAWMAVHGYEQAAPFWEEFVSDPGQTPEADLVTNLFVPIK